MIPQFISELLSFTCSVVFVLFTCFIKILVLPATLEDATHLITTHNINHAVHFSRNSGRRFWHRCCPEQHYCCNHYLFVRCSDVRINLLQRLSSEKQMLTLQSAASLTSASRSSRHATLNALPLTTTVSAPATRTSLCATTNALTTPTHSPLLSTKSNTARLLPSKSNPPALEPRMEELFH